MLACFTSVQEVHIHTYKSDIIVVFAITHNTDINITLIFVKLCAIYLIYALLDFNSFHIYLDLYINWILMCWLTYSYEFQRYDITR